MNQSPEKWKKRDEQRTEDKRTKTWDTNKTQEHHKNTKTKALIVELNKKHKLNTSTTVICRLTLTNMINCYLQTD
jgi:hypothetical protein